MEENKKGQNTLYAVIGVATLIVAIIGATFAYFSASATSKDGDIQGETNDVGGALTLEVNRLNFFSADSEEKPDSDNLIPADLGLANAVPTATELTDILNAKCVGDGDVKYTGCHVYKISTHSTQPVSAKLLLQKFNVTATDAASWKYIIFKGNDTTDEGVTTSATATELVTNPTGSFATTDEATLTGENPGDGLGRIVDNITMETYVAPNIEQSIEEANVYNYYLMIYLENKDKTQNNNDDADNNGVGQYSGSVLLDAGDGSGLVATFNHS